MLFHCLQVLAAAAVAVQAIAVDLLPRSPTREHNLELLRRKLQVSPLPPVSPSSTISRVTYAPTPTPSLAERATSDVDAAAATCPHLVIDDWVSQSRLTFLYYNALNQPTSDDGTMTSITVHNDNTVTLVPASQDSSYFYSQLPCVDTETDKYGGIVLSVKAAAGVSFDLQVASADVCGSGNFTGSDTVSSSTLGWTFDGTLKTYSVPFSKFPNVDKKKASMIFFSGLSSQVTLGPMALYCGDKATAVPAPAHPVNPQDEHDVEAPAAPSSAQLVIDKFDNENTNALDLWHGGDEGFGATFGSNGIQLKSDDADLSWYTLLSDTCADIAAYNASYLHLSFTGSTQFTIALQQSNEACNASAAPHPETWDSVEARRYVNDAGTDLYIPLSHFEIDLKRAVGFSFKGFYNAYASVTLRKLEIVASVPSSGFAMPNKVPSGQLVFACKRPNSFAFAIDDGDPQLAQEVMEIVRSENILVTFFTVGLPLEDLGTNLSSVYLDMQARGHQIALHSFTHPKLEGLPDYAAIDWEYNNDLAAMRQTFGSKAETKYFRPPFGTEGARMRQRLSAALNVTDPYLVMWSVDVEDWLWAQSDTPEKQLDAFKRDLAKGGNLVVMHYLYPETVQYLRQFIQLAKATGKQLMRVDQCMEDPDAPAL